MPIRNNDRMIDLGCDMATSPNNPSSATQRTGRHDCNRLVASESDEDRDAPAEFAAA